MSIQRGSAITINYLIIINPQSSSLISNGWPFHWDCFQAMALCEVNSMVLVANLSSYGHTVRILWELIEKDHFIS